ncbi:HBL/NHE enterotoxin family protein [Pseudomonas syringae]|uniref:alpha-pore-forming cytotoxin MakA n=1 Tax=Pseudomonas syringae TaxID=317 RepID=UPI001916EF87|nr:HBL/NHE enterotoxin family protein [Pseudomonas syringae]QQQ50783.1 HBL/NHE enterotoxin family protein [Pseudomonas syringae]
MTASIPQPALQSKTQNGFLSLVLITQACHGVLNTTFTAPDPKPSWYDALSAHLDEAKVVASDWVDNIAPAVTASVPQAVLDYGTTYQAITAEIVSICQANPNASGADNQYVKQVQQLIGGLLGEITDILTIVDKNSTQLKAWGDRLQTAHDNLSSGASSIQNTEVALQSDIVAMNTAIQNLNDTITQLNKDMMYAQIAVGAGIFLGVVALALVPISGGASLLVGLVAGAMIVGGAIEWSSFQSEIKSDFQQIARDQVEKSSDQAQIVALQGLATASNQAISSMVQAESSLSDFRTSWAGFHDDLQGVLNDLTKAEKSLSTLLEMAFTNAAANEWQLAIDFATTLQGTQIHMPATQMDMDGKITSKAA